MFPSVELLQPKFAARLRQFGTTPEEQQKCAAVADLVEGIEKFRKALFAYAENPSGSNKHAALSALEDLRNDDVNKAWHEGLDFLKDAHVPTALNRDDELRLPPRRPQVVLLLRDARRPPRDLHPSHPSGRRQDP